MSRFSQILLLLVLANITFAQKPILLNKTVLSGVGLKKIDLKDEPEKDFYQKNLYWGKDIGVFVVSTENWTNEIKDYPFDEFIYLFHGESIVKPNIGTSQSFHTGDFFHVPRGFKGQWEIRGGEHLHYELSVITTTRADSSKVIENAEAKLIDHASISGNSIVLNEAGYYEKVLQQGSELTVKLIGEKPSIDKLENSYQEQLIHLISGQITIVVEDETFIFYSGDYFVLPEGKGYQWKGEGHGLVKYLTIFKTR